MPTTDRPVPPAMLTEGELARGVRMLHELPGDRQREVLALLKAQATIDSRFGVALG